MVWVWIGDSIRGLEVAGRRLPGREADSMGGKTLEFCQFFRRGSGEVR
jgi:hypothetical protein